MLRRIRPISILCALVAATFALSACNRNVGSPDIAPHLISTPEAEPVRPVDAFEECELSELSSASGDIPDSEYRARVEELYNIVVHDGKKPIFRDNDPVRDIYDAARDILDNYILNAWHDDAAGEYNIVHTIHDYLAVNIEYDFELYDKYMANQTEFDGDPAFSIDGVFINKLAVCDGLSRAFCFLAAIEGVECTRETGMFDGISHAWNRVRVGEEYYNVDVTADAAHYRIGSGGYKKQLSHGFFMISDNTLRSFMPKRHEPVDTMPIHPAVSDGDYYSNKMMTVGGQTFPCVITDQDMLNRLFTAVSEQNGKVGKLEVKLAFEGKLYVNDADMYREEIAAAYSRLKNPDFEPTATQTPYFQYPNGVYLFLMYV